MRAKLIKEAFEKKSVEARRDELVNPHIKNIKNLDDLVQAKRDDIYVPDWKEKEIIETIKNLYDLIIAKTNNISVPPQKEKDIIEDDIKDFDSIVLAQYYKFQVPSWKEKEIIETISFKEKLHYILFDKLDKKWLPDKEIYTNLKELSTFDRMNIVINFKLDKKFMPLKSELDKMKLKDFEIKLPIEDGDQYNDIYNKIIFKTEHIEIRWETGGGGAHEYYIQKSSLPKDKYLYGLADQFDLITYKGKEAIIFDDVSAWHEDHKRYKNQEHVRVLITSDGKVYDDMINSSLFKNINEAFEKRSKQDRITELIDPALKEYLPFIPPYIRENIFEELEDLEELDLKRLINDTINLQEKRAQKDIYVNKIDYAKDETIIMLKFVIQDNIPGNLDNVPTLKFVLEYGTVVIHSPEYGLEVTNMILGKENGSYHITVIRVIDLIKVLHDSVSWVYNLDSDDGPFYV